ncbi:hypothetical protein ACSSS7_006496 [Eimeria intestinalis]
MRNQDSQQNWITVVRRARGTRAPQMPSRRGGLRAPEPRPPPTVPSAAPSREQWEAHWPVLGAGGGESQAAGESEERRNESTQHQRGEASGSAEDIQISSASTCQAMDGRQDPDTGVCIEFPISYICDDEFESCVDPTSGTSALDASFRQREIRMDPPLFPDEREEEAPSPTIQPKARPEERGTDQMPSELERRIATNKYFRKVILEVEEALEEKIQIDQTSKELLLRRYEAASRVKQLEQQRRQDEVNQPQESKETTGSPAPRGPGHEYQSHAGVGAIGNLLSQAHIQAQAVLRTLPQLLKRLQHAIDYLVIFVDPDTYRKALDLRDKLEEAVDGSTQTQRSLKNSGGGSQPQATSRRGLREQQGDVQLATSSGSDQFPRSTHQRRVKQHQGGDEQQRRAHFQHPYDNPPLYSHGGSRGYIDTGLTQAAYRNGSRVVGRATFVPAPQVEEADMREIFRESVARACGGDVPPPRPKTVLYKGPPQGYLPQQLTAQQPVAGPVPFSDPASIWEMPPFHRPSHHQPTQDIRNQAQLFQHIDTNNSQRQQLHLPQHLTSVQFGNVAYQQFPHHRIAGEILREQPQGTRLQPSNKRNEESYAFQQEKQKQQTLIDQLDFLSVKRCDQQQDQQDDKVDVEDWDDKWHEDPLPILPIHLQHNENNWNCHKPQEAPYAIEEGSLSAVDLYAQAASTRNQLGASPNNRMPSGSLGSQLPLHEVLKNQLVLPLREKTISPQRDPLIKWSSEWPLEAWKEKEDKSLQFKSSEMKSTRLDANGYVPFADWYANYFPEWTFASPAKEEATACCDAAQPDNLSMTDTPLQETNEPDSPHANSRNKSMCTWGSDKEAR